MKEHGRSAEVENKCCESAERRSERGMNRGDIDSDMFVCCSDYFTFVLLTLFQRAMELEGKIKFHKLL